jgi:F-type H+-transporting ATPase subunit delta
MRGASRDSLKRALASYEESIGALPDAAGSSDVSEGLYAVAALLDREPSLRRALTDPASSPASRRALVDQLLGRQLTPLPLGVFQDLVADRWDSAVDLRSAVEVLAANAAMRAAEGEGVLDDVEDELFRFARLLDREPALRAALTDPGLPVERKSALLRDLLGAQARPITQRLVEIAVTRPQAGSLESALEELSRLAAQRRQRYVATVRVAQPLDLAQQERLAGSLARIYGRQVQLQVDVDPSVIGGIEVRVGDEVIDGTVARRLQDVRRTFAGQ